MSVASAGNDHRLGANEAPPAIISMFLGDELGAVVDALVDDHEYTCVEKVSMDLGVPSCRASSRTRRTATAPSPFAFTGNKFEFRMPGTAVNLSDCNTILNTAMAKSLKDFADALEGVPEGEFEAAAVAYVKRTLKAHARIIFNGDGYSTNGKRRAAPPGACPTHRTRPTRCRASWSARASSFWDSSASMSEAEVRSRYEVKLEKYTKLLNIEARTMKRMVRRAFLPAINRYAAELAQGVAAIKAACVGAETTQQEKLLHTLLAGVREIDDQLQKARYDAPCGSRHRRRAKEGELLRARDHPGHGRFARGRGRHGDPRGSRSLAGAQLHRPAVLRVADKAGAPGSAVWREAGASGVRQR